MMYACNVQADVSFGDEGSSSESDMESEPRPEREGERVTVETIQNWVQSATAKKVSIQWLCLYICVCVHVYACGVVLWIFGSE